jgi:hypothetical protein
MKIPFLLFAHILATIVKLALSKNSTENKYLEFPQ